jgi:hypothetical protein
VANDISVASNVHFNMATAKPEVVLTATPDAILMPFQLQRWVLGINQLKRSAINDAVLQTTFTLILATLKFNMASDKSEIVLTCAPEARFTPFQRE